MPLYEYRCPACGDTLERFRSGAQRDTLVSSCASTDDAPHEMQRVITAPHLHGSPNMPND